MSRFKGVCWYRQRRKWQASIYLSGGKKKHLGRSSESMPSSPRHAEGGALVCVVQGTSSRRWTVSTNWVAMVGRGTTRLPATRPDVLLSPHVVVLSLSPPRVLCSCQGLRQVSVLTTHRDERTNEVSRLRSDVFCPGAVQGGRVDPRRGLGGVQLRPDDWQGTHPPTCRRGLHTLA